METCDPLKASDAKPSLTLDEPARIAGVLSYRRRARIRAPNLQVHAMMHGVVENQGRSATRRRFGLRHNA